MICLTGCSGPAAEVNLYPLAGDHIIDVSKGQTFEAPRDGYFLSNEYMIKVLKVKVKEF